MSTAPPRIAITCGEPAGIGPELTLALASQAWPAELVVFADMKLLAARASTLGQQLELVPWVGNGATPVPSRPGRLLVADLPLRAPSAPGHPDPRNSPWVLELLKRATAGCRLRQFAAMVTAPVHKAVINDAGIPFTGHTEFLAQLTSAAKPVMLLVAGELRVALATTHLPLHAVPAAINRALVETTGRILDSGLRKLFGIRRPRIVVLGLNPHAGESGHLGTEEIREISPALASLQQEGIAISGPVPADTAFVDRNLANVDAVLAMYHDQGLPVLKHHGFGRAVNVTLGLPIIRTSVDHGTAIDLAGTGRADAGSLRAAVKLAIEMAARQQS
jgi:4-hydroxythreonine-4-phosphate dehydrogenase